MKRVGTMFLVLSVLIGVSAGCGKMQDNTGWKGATAQDMISAAEPEPAPSN